MEELLQLKQEVTMLREVAAQSEVENSTQRSTIIQATTQGVEEEEVNEQANIGPSSIVTVNSSLMDSETLPSLTDRPTDIRMQNSEILSQQIAL